MSEREGIKRGGQEPGNRYVHDSSRCPAQVNCYPSLSLARLIRPLGLDFWGSGNSQEPFNVFFCAQLGGYDWTAQCPCLMVLYNLMIIFLYDSQSHPSSFLSHITSTREREKTTFGRSGRACGVTVMCCCCNNCGSSVETCSKCAKYFTQWCSSGGQPNNALTRRHALWSWVE